MDITFRYTKKPQEGEIPKLQKIVSAAGGVKYIGNPASCI